MLTQEKYLATDYGQKIIPSVQGFSEQTARQKVSLHGGVIFVKYIQMDQFHPV